MKSGSMSTRSSLPPCSSSSTSGLRAALLSLDSHPRSGGMQQYLIAIVRRIGRRCSLTVLHPDGNPPLFSEEPFRLVTFGQNSSVRLPDAGKSRSTPGAAVLASWRIARALAALRPHLPVVGHAHPRLRQPATMSKGRYLVLANGNDFETAQLRWHAPIFNRLLAGAQPLVTKSHANAQRLQKLGLPRPEMLTPRIEPDRFTPPASPPSGLPVLLTVACLVSRKGIDTVLQALPQLLDRTPFLQYRGVGNGPARSSLEQLAQELGLTQTMCFIDAVSDSELPEVYQKATVFVMTSRAEYHASTVEGFGIVYLEASASGMTVVAARSGGAAEAVIEDETGLLVPPDDPPALAQAISRLLNGAALRAGWAVPAAAGSKTR